MIWVKQDNGLRILLEENDEIIDTKFAYEFADEAIRQAAAWYTRNTVPTYSKVPIAIQALRRTPFGNFVSFPAEMLRTSFNNMNISMREAGSNNAVLRSMGYRGLMGMFTVMGGASYAVKSLYNNFTGFDEEKLRLFKKHFEPPKLRFTSSIYK